MAGRAWIEAGDPGRFERLLDDALMGYLKTARRGTFGPAHVVAYMAAVESEGQAIRLILAARIGKLPREVVYERLRDTYVS